MKYIKFKFKFKFTESEVMHACCLKVSARKIMTIGHFAEKKLVLH